MPSIEITEEQAKALARGEDVTLKPAKRRIYILVALKGGAVWEIDSAHELPTGRLKGLRTENVIARCLRYPGAARLGNLVTRFDIRDSDLHISEVIDK